MLGLREVSPEREQWILKELEEAAQLHAPFFVLVATSAIIAAFGLLLNSPAVIIGAMLVAPLMTPIFSLSVALIRGRTTLLRRALRTEAYGVGLAILLALFIGLLAPEPDLTHEILSRTQPTLFDLAVALAAGLAGAFALVREEISPALPGVAIAVALLPPLGVVGLGLSMRRLDVAGGALVLFLANFVAIHLVSAGVFYLSGLATHTVERNPRVLLKNFGAAVVLLVVMTVFLGAQLSTLVHRARDARLARSLLEQQVKMVAGARLSDLEVRCQAGACQVVATVETPELFEPSLVGGIQNVMEAQMDHKVELLVRSVQMSEASAAGYRFQREKPPPKEEKPAAAPPPTAPSPAERIRQVLAEQARMVPGAKLVDFHYDPAAQPPRVVATYLAREPFGEPLERGIANLVRAEIGQDVALELGYVGPLPAPERQPVPKKSPPTRE